MTGWTLIRRSLRHHWRAHLGVLLGATLSAAILIGALAVGDSVRYSLHRLALLRLGKVRLALNAHDRFFRAELADELAGDMQADVVPAILVRGTAVGYSRAGDEAGRSGRVQVIGFADGFWRLGSASAEPGGDGAVLNERLALKLGVRTGDEVLLRVDKPSLLSRDAPLSTVEDASVTLRLPVARIAGDGEYGRFSLEANQVPPLNAFVPIELLQQQLALPGRANVLLVAEGSPGTAVPNAAAALARHWNLADASLELRELPAQKVAELRTDRVFLDPPVGQAATHALPDARGVLTYFVNELRVGSRTTPYSIVAALQGAPLPAGMQDNEILINQWLAEDLQARSGDELKLTYFVVGPMRRLEPRSTTFRIRSIIPIAGAAADRELMPPFPGVANARNCRDWDLGIPVDLSKIRDKDEAYWDAYRGTPKAFVTLRAGQQMWNNRFGSLTAVRYPSVPAGAGMGGSQAVPGVEACIRQALNPAMIGLFFTPVRDQALAAGSQALDFGQLFLGFSFFLILAALLLTALLFALAVEQRSEEAGILLAIGYPPRRVQRLLLGEGAALALVASALGMGAGVLYTRAVIHGLSTVWRGAVGETTLQFHVEPATLAGGALAAFLVALLAIWLVARRQAKSPARDLLAGEFVERGGGSGEGRGERGEGKRPSLRTPVWANARSRTPNAERRTPNAQRPMTAVWAVSCFVLALLLVGAALAGDRSHGAIYFFSAGALLLASGILGCRALLAWMERTSGSARLTVASLGVRNSARRRGRSLAAVALLACGSFLVVAIGANRHDPQEDAARRSSGAGGFALYAQSTLPVYQDLNSQAGREELGLDSAELQGARVVPLRVREGDEASCLNLNRAQVPRLLGVDPKALADLTAFTFTGTADKAGSEGPWSLLSRREPEGTVPAIGDMNTVEWALGSALGGTIPYVDDRGNPFQLRIVGVMANSILQGGLLISEENFVRLFPSRSGYQVFLIDAPPERTAAVAQELGRGLEDVGMDLTPAPQRLTDFNTVENTYLSIFAVLGGLGLLLGTLGLGVIVLRNVLERRGEMALLRAVGFRERALQWLVFSEHSLLLALGLLLGVFSALVAVLPALQSPGAQVPYVSLGLTLAAVFLSGFLWTWMATTLALRGPLLTALRNE